MIDAGWLQSPSPSLVTARDRKTTVAPGVSPRTIVFAWRVTGAETQVFPPSALYCHSYEARRATVSAVRWTEPDVGPNFAANVRLACTATFRSATPALWMTEADVSGSASATDWM